MAKSPQDPERGLKSAEEIGSTLRSIHAVRRQPEPGSAVSGLEAADRLVLDSFPDRDAARAAQRSLTNKGIMSSLKAGRSQVELVVDYEDREKAAEILRQHKQTHPTVHGARTRPDHDFLILGVVLGVTIGLVLLVSNFHGLLMLVVPATLAVAGGLLGHLADRFRMQYRRRGRFGLGVWEFLILATLPAIAIFLWNFVSYVVHSA